MLKYNKFLVTIISWIALYGLILSPIIGSYSFFIRLLSVAGLNLLWLYSIINKSNFTRLEVLAIAGYSILLVSCLIRSLFSPYGVIGFLNHWGMYLGYLPLYFLMRQWLYSRSYELIVGFLNFNFWLVFFILIGVSIDGIFKLNDYIGMDLLNRIDADGTRRANFVLAAPTAIFFSVFYCFTMLIINRSSLAFMSVFVFVAFLATWYTYSRLPLLLLISYFSFHFIFSLKSKNYFGSILFFIFSSVLILLSFSFLDVALSYSGYVGKLLNLFSAGDDANSNRLSYYLDFLNMIQSQDLMYSIFGYGLGSASLNLNALLFNSYIGHFESTLLSVGVEMGLIWMTVAAVVGIRLIISAFRVGGSFGFGVTCLLLNLLMVPLHNGYQVPYLMMLNLFLVFEYSRSVACNSLPPR